MVQITEDRFSKLDFVIENAGFAFRLEEPLLDLPLDKLEEYMRVQFEVFPIAFVKPAVAVTRAMYPYYAEVKPDSRGHVQDSGSILIVLSETALTPPRDDLLAYAAAKKACFSIMRNLAATLGSKNIRVNGIALGFANNKGQKYFCDRYSQIRKDISDRNHLQPAFMHPGSIVSAMHYIFSNQVSITGT